MSQFDLLNNYLSNSVAKPVLRYFKNQYGIRNSSAIKIEQPFSEEVAWSPTIQVKLTSTQTILIEVSEIIYPQIFRTAYASLLNEEAIRPIMVYQACPLVVYQAGKKEIREMKSHGFGLVTVDDAGHVDIQFPAIVIIHHIPRSRYDQLVQELPRDVKSALSRAFDVYRTEPSQGLQSATQIVEALIHLIAKQSYTKGLLTNYNQSDTSAKVIDQLYTSTNTELTQQRACFGGARQSMKLDRNPSSHPAKSKRQARTKSMSIREGFENSLRICAELCRARNALGFKKRLTL